MSRAVLVKLAVVAAALLVAAIVTGALFLRSLDAGFTNSPVFRAALVRARIDSRVYAALGTPIEPGSISGTRNLSGGWESSEMSFSIRGPRGQARVELEAEARSEDVTFSRLEAVLPSGRVNLLAPVSPPVVESNEDCRYAPDCRNDGRCVHRDGRCVVGSWEDCRASAACRTEGRCYQEAGECRPVNEGHCQQSEACTKKGRCNLNQGRCALPPSFCHNGRGCLENGACTLKGDACIAATDADCAQAAVCEKNRLCHAKGGICVASPSVLPSVGGLLMIGKPSIAGKLDAAAVSRELEAAHDRLLACYQRGLQQDSKLRGRVALGFVIGRDGTVANVSTLGSALRSDSVLSCMGSTVYALKFPEPKHGIVTVRATARLEP